jgi:hypothetical protein
MLLEPSPEVCKKEPMVQRGEHKTTWVVSYYYVSHLSHHVSDSIAASGFVVVESAEASTKLGTYLCRVWGSTYCVTSQLGGQ